MPFFAARALMAAPPNPVGSAVILATVILGILGIAYLHRVNRARMRLLDQRQRFEDALRESEVFYHSLVESLPQTILRKDTEGRFTFASDRFCRELGRSLDEIVGRTDLDFFPRELAEKYRRDDRRVIETGEPVEVVEEHITPGGERLYVQVVKTPLHGPDDRVIGMQGIFWDVTERKLAEEQLRLQNERLQEMARSEHQAHSALKRAQGQLVQQEKLASLGLLVAGVAHEINNPLAFVINNIAVLERDLGEVLRLLRLYEGEDETGETASREEIARFREEADIGYTLRNLPDLLQRTREGLRRIQRIVSDLRAFGRVDEGEVSEVDLNAGIESTVTIALGHAKKKGVALATELSPLPRINCHAAKINQVVLNLLTNAIDACENGGHVTVRTYPERDGVRIEVADDGCGMPPSVSERIFDPFFTTKPVGQGTGLGLSITYGIVQDHGGTIELDSEPGQGTCFKIHLPSTPPVPTEGASSVTSVTDGSHLAGR